MNRTVRMFSERTLIAFPYYQQRVVQFRSIQKWTDYVTYSIENLNDLFCTLLRYFFFATKENHNTNNTKFIDVHFIIIKSAVCASCKMFCFFEIFSFLPMFSFYLVIFMNYSFEVPMHFYDDFFGALNYFLGFTFKAQ